MKRALPITSPVALSWSRTSFQACIRNFRVWSGGLDCKGRMERAQGSDDKSTRGSKRGEADSLRSLTVPHRLRLLLELVVVEHLAMSVEEEGVECHLHRDASNSVERP